MRRPPESTGSRPIRKGDAKPPPEPEVRLPSLVEGRRVGTTLPLETFIRFKARIAREGVTGQQAILNAIERMLGDGSLLGTPSA